MARRSPPSHPSHTRLEYRPELDGLRALSVLIVVLHHVPGVLKQVLPGAWLGVDLFFALSGALITRLLLIELDTTRTLSLTRFYLRRLRRLYPAMLTMIAAAVLAALVVLGPGFARALWPDAALAALYLAGFIVHERAIPLVGHTWSLSIEEIFYLVWPACLLVLAKRSLRPAVLLMGLVVVAAPAWRMNLWLVEFVSTARIYYAPDTRADAIAWGVLAGFAVHTGQASRHARLLAPLAWAGAVGLGAFLIWASRSAAWFAIWGYSLTAIFSSLIVAYLFVRRAPWLASAPLVWLGKRSYSIYLWHFPVFQLGQMRGASFLLLVPLALLLAMASYRFVEQPLRARH